MKRVIISTKSFSDSNAHKQVIIYLKLSSHHMLGCRPMERTNGSYTILYLIAIIISVFTLNRCWSYVGRTGTKQQLSLAGGCWRHGTVAHEIGEFFFKFPEASFKNTFTQSLTQSSSTQQQPSFITVFRFLLYLTPARRAQIVSLSLSQQFSST